MESRTTDRVEQFRIRDLPQELRDRIYEFAIEPRADFRLMGRKRIEPSMFLPTVSIRKDTDSMSSIVLVFNLITSTPLLLLSKSVRAEVQELLQRLRPIWHDIIESAGDTNSAKSPCLAFQKICSRSRFTLDESPDYVFWFLKNIPEWMKSCIRNIIITRACLAKRRGIDAWDPYGNRCEFMNNVQARCTSLNSIALEVPSVISGGQFALHSATRFLLELLVEKVVTSVHFVQRNISDNPHDKFIFDTLDKLTSFLDTTVTPQQPEESSMSRAVARGFDVFEESGDSHEWAHFGFERALRISWSS